MKKSELRSIIREQIRKIMSEKTQEEIDADKKAVEAQLMSAKLKIKVAQANLKSAKDQVSALNKKRARISSEQPTPEETEKTTV